MSAKSLQAKAKGHLQDIWLAETKDRAEKRGSSVSCQEPKNHAHLTQVTTRRHGIPTCTRTFAVTEFLHGVVWLSWPVLPICSIDANRLRNVVETVCSQKVRELLLDLDDESRALEDEGSV